jgi:hypothetical protein
MRYGAYRATHERSLLHVSVLRMGVTAMAIIEENAR